MQCYAACVGSTLHELVHTGFLLVHAAKLSALQFVMSLRDPASGITCAAARRAVVLGVISGFWAAWTIGKPSGSLLPHMRNRPALHQARQLQPLQSSINAITRKPAATTLLVTTTLLRAYLAENELLKFGLAFTAPTGHTCPRNQV